jgi:hypothetical protein
MFKRSWPGTFTGTIFPALDGDTVYVGDLTPNTTYSISGGGVTSATTDTAGVLTFSDALSGNVTVGSAIAPTQATGRGFTASGGTFQ